MKSMKELFYLVIIINLPMNIKGRSLDYKSSR